MSVLKEIQQWAPGLPLWQQDAIVRLFSKDELDVADYDDLYALLKTEQGIADPKKRTAKTLGTSQVAAAPNSQRLVQLAAIKNLRNVNALAENQTIPFNLTGLTVIYGDNGSGKSGYSRALKKACRARDREEILPNAKLPIEKVGKPEATFELIVDGKADEVVWLDGVDPPEQLAAIAIFDAHCARSYIDEQDDYSYVPYGLDILAGLAKACNRLKSMIEAEQAQTVPNVAVFAALSNASTEVGKLLTALSTKTKLKDVEALAILSQAQIDRHATLGKSLKEPDPKEKASQSKLRSGRVAGLSERCSEKATKVSNLELAKLRSLADASSLAKDAADLAARQFREAPGQLPGTGGEAWQVLFEAARGFAAESHPGKIFPHLGPESSCPLCQQPLGRGAGRLVAFDAFIQQEAEKTARERRKAFKDACQLFEKADLGILLDAELKAELTAMNADLGKSCEKFGLAISARRDAIKAACNAQKTWDEITALPSDPTEDLKALANSLADEAATLEKAADGEARTALEVEFKELDARKQLGPLKSSVLETIAKMVLQAKLKACLGTVKTNTISIKSTELTQNIVSKELAEALNAEYKRLNVCELSVSLRSFAEKGKTFHKLVLQLPGEQRPAAILSEGEQRSIAIASFLAEVNIGGSKGGIVFDDPVSSLDHRRRGLVAARLAEEARKRQVIVFTHDVYFLCVLQMECESAFVPISALTVHQKPEGFGVAAVGLPFEGARTAARVGILRQRQVECAKLHKTGDAQEYDKRARTVYGDLRIAWERAVEEVLLGEVVTRFREGIETKRLLGVIVEDSDCRAVTTGMSKCSKYAAHDTAALANISMPPPDELKADIEALETWRKAIDTRSKETREKRKVAATLGP